MNSDFLKSLDLSSNRRMLEDLVSKSASDDEETQSMTASRDRLDPFELKQKKRDKRADRVRVGNINEMRQFHNRILELQMLKEKGKESIPTLNELNLQELERKRVQTAHNKSNQSDESAGEDDHASAIKKQVTDAMVRLQSGYKSVEDMNPLTMRI